MLETWILIRKYSHVWSFSKDDFYCQDFLLILFSVFVSLKVTINENIEYYRPYIWNPASGLLQIDHQQEKWQRPHNFLT